MKNELRPEPIVVGDAPEEEKNKLKKEFLLKFKESHFKKFNKNPEILLNLKHLEYPKKNYEKKAIKKGNEILNFYLEKFINKSFDAPINNIHIIPEEVFVTINSENKDSLGVCFLEDQEIFINASKLKNEFLRVSTIFHEMIHLVSYVSFNYFNYFKGLRRGGLEIYSLLNIDREINKGDSNVLYSFNYFNGLNEALVTYLEKKHYFDIIFSDSYLRKKYQRLNSEDNKKFIKDLVQELNLSEDEVFIIDNLKDEEGKIIRVPGYFPYYEQRMVLDFLMKEIAADNDLDEEKVEELFLKSYFSGKLKDLGVLIEKSFGEGSFRKIAEMTIEKTSAIYCLKNLIKARKRVLNNKNKKGV